MKQVDEKEYTFSGGCINDALNGECYGTVEFWDACRHLEKSEKTVNKRYMIQRTEITTKGKKPEVSYLVELSEHSAWRSLGVINTLTTKDACYCCDEKKIAYLYHSYEDAVLKCIYESRKDHNRFFKIITIVGD